jgi:hypothetical protein
MKNTTLSILILAILTTYSSANEIQKKTVGTTVGKYAKNGLAVDLSYSTQDVDVGENSEVNLTLTTSLTTGELKVKLLSLDKDLDGIDTELLTFHPSSESQSFPIQLKLSSASEGKHYLDVHVSMENQGGRVFVVPVTVGTVVKKPMSSNVQKTSTNELLSISKGVEVIK